MLAAASHAVMLAIFVLGALLGLLAWQNRDLRARLRATGRPPARVLGEALRLWSPLALAIALATLAAHALSDAALALVHRATPLDAWCKVLNADGQPSIPCSGRAGEEPRSALRHVPQREAVERLVLERYAVALDRLGGTNAQSTDLRSLSPAVVLGLPLGPQDDPELQRLRAELQRLLDTPAAPARSPLDLLRARGDAEIRARRLRELSALVRGRREALAQAAYGGLPQERQGRLWLQHRLAHSVAAAQWPVESLRPIVAAHAEEGRDAPALDVVLRTKLAADAAASLEVMAREDANRLSRAALGVAMPTPAWCRFEGASSPVFACPRLQAGESLRLARLDAYRALRLSLARWRDETRREGLRLLGESGLATRRGLASARERVASLPRRLQALAFPARASCSAWRPATCAERVVGAGMARALAPGGAWGADAVGALDEALEWRIGVVAEQLWQDIDVVQAQARSLGEDWLQLHARVRVAAWLLLAFLAAKSFLYVLALSAFRHGGPQVLGLGGDAGPQGEVRVGRRLTLDPAFEDALVTHRQLSNSDNHLRLAPWPGSAPIARLLHGRYLWFTRGRLLAREDAQGQGRIASADAGRAIVEWRLQPGEQVVFGWRDFFGASENLRFRTRLSFRLSTLLLGRVLFRIAEAPAHEAGVLLLRADVEQVEDAGLHAVPPERLLAWNRQVRFRAHGAETAWGVLVHGLTLVREPSAGGRVVAISEDAGPRFGSLRFLRRILGAIF